MKRIIIAGLAIAAGATTLLAQPKPKSQKEVDALMAVQNAASNDARIEAVDKLITGFSDTEFKDWALFLAANAYAAKNEPEKAIVYCERTVEANPKHFQALLMLAEITAQRTGEHDLDREEKLNRATKYANDAIAAVNSAAKPNPQVTDDQWAAAKKDVVAQAHQALGMVALSRKKGDEAVAEFKKAIEGSSQPEPAF